MTQAFNLSQLANNVNTSGLLNAAAGLYNQTPVANGGTGKASVTSGRLLLGAGTSAMTELTGGTAGEVVTWNGSAWGSAAGAGGALQTYTVAVTPGTWTKPATLKGVKVTVIGGGGAGGTSATSPHPSTGPRSNVAGGGGAGGTSIRLYPAPSLPGPQPYTVGGAGATSSFGVAPISVISATGGVAAQTSPTTNAGGAGGNGGVGSGGQISTSGSSGFSGMDITTAIYKSGSGGVSILGGGANGFTSASNGSAGVGYGGGGSGGASSGSGPGTTIFTQTGGAGASGVVIIEEFY